MYGDSRNSSANRIYSVQMLRLELYCVCVWGLLELLSEQLGSIVYVEIRSVLRLCMGSHGTPLRTGSIVEEDRTSKFTHANDNARRSAHADENANTIVPIDNRERRC